MVGPWLATAFSVGMLAVLLIGERRRDRRVRYLAKPLASVGFVLVPVTAGADLGAPVAAWIVAGLVLGMGGDILLLVPGRRAFLAGLTTFLLGHVAYVVAFAQLVPPGRWVSAPMWIVIAPVLLATAGVVRWLWPHLGSMKAPVIAYVVVIATMLVGGIATARWAHESLDACARALVASGAAAFFASDLAVARDRFVSEGFVNRAWGLPAYYAGQLLIAWSIAPT